MIRSPREIAGRAIIHGALGFRASLEVTDHPRVDEYCSDLLPWLEKLGLGPQVTECDRDILEIGHGRLSTEQRAEAYWRGESAALLGWAIELLDSPDRYEPIDPSVLVKHLKLLQPRAADVLDEATLRPKEDIEAFCAFCLAVRLHYQKSSVAEEVARNLDEIYRKRLVGIGLGDILPAYEKALDAASVFVSTTLEPRGLYVVRALASEWLLGRSD